MGWWVAPTYPAPKHGLAAPPPALPPTAPRRSLRGAPRRQPAASTGIRQLASVNWQARRCPPPPLSAPPVTPANPNTLARPKSPPPTGEFLVPCGRRAGARHPRLGLCHAPRAAGSPPDPLLPAARRPPKSPAPTGESPGALAAGHPASPPAPTANPQGPASRGGAAAQPERPRALAAATGRDAGRRGVPRGEVTTCTGPWPDPYRHALPRSPPSTPPPHPEPPPQRTNVPAGPDGPGLPLHRLSDHRWVWCQPCNRSVPKTQLGYRSLLYDVPIQKVLPATKNGNFPIVSGPVYMRKTCHKGLRNFGPPVGRQLANPAVNWHANWHARHRERPPPPRLKSAPATGADPPSSRALHPRASGQGAPRRPKYKNAKIAKSRNRKLSKCPNRQISTSRHVKRSKCQKCKVSEMPKQNRGAPQRQLATSTGEPAAVEGRPGHR